MQGAEVLTIGTGRERWCSKEKCRARMAWGRSAWEEEMDNEKASKVAEQVRRAEKLMAELAAQSEKKVSEVCSHPPGLHGEPAEHIVASHMEARGSHTLRPQCCKPNATPGRQPLCAHSLPAAVRQGFFAPRLRGVRRASRTKTMAKYWTFMSKPQARTRTNAPEVREHEARGEVESSGEYTQRRRSASKTRKRERGSSTETRRASR